MTFNPNPDHVLGLGRFIQRFPNIEISGIIGTFTTIFTEHANILEDLESDEGGGLAPADAIYDMLLEWFDDDIPDPALRSLPVLKPTTIAGYNDESD